MKKPRQIETFRQKTRTCSILAVTFAAFLFSGSTAAPVLLGQEQVNSSRHAAPSNAQLASPAIEKRVDALLKQMTLEEKLGQLVQYSDSGYDGQAQTAAEAAAAPGKNP
jgi:beta-glucosidase